MLRMEKDIEAHDAMRVKLRATCEESGFDRNESDLIADLVMQGIDSAFEALMRVANSAPEGMRNTVMSVAIMALADIAGICTEMVLDAARAKLSR